ncbi:MULTISPECIES: hypothetical protein [Cellulomonas]|uniref:hypothetical protein n=1 Tax=Cellulomonas TaxID=1707 RepID=UPI0010A86D9D|nr:MULTISPECIES: hypothetical protein [Cellulomonas]
MGRHAGRETPPEPWSRRLAASALRWAGRLVLGAVTGAVVLVALRWAGLAGTSATTLAVGAGVVVVLAAAVAATVPPPPPAPDDTAPGAPDGWTPGRRSHGS